MGSKTDLEAVARLIDIHWRNLTLGGLFNLCVIDTRYSVDDDLECLLEGKLGDYDDAVHDPVRWWQKADEIRWADSEAWEAFYDHVDCGRWPDDTGW